MVGRESGKVVQVVTYLDAASSEPLHPATREVLLAVADQGYADPRRLHREARSARLLLDNARDVVAACLQVRPDEVSFVPSGTHAVHAGVLAGAARRGNVLAHPAVEHSAVLHAGRWHEAHGGRVTSVPVDAEGRVAVTDLARTGATVLAVQAANHEVGTTQPVTEAAALGVPVFTDACALIGRLPLPAGWSAAAGSAHKWGGPAGVGLLLVRKGARWRNPWPVDDRVDERSIGFENVPGALAAAAALRAVVDDAEETGARQRRLVDRVREAAAAVPDVEVVGDPLDRLPHLVT